MRNIPRKRTNTSLLLALSTSSMVRTTFLLQVLQNFIIFCDNMSKSIFGVRFADFQYLMMPSSLAQASIILSQKYLQNELSSSQLFSEYNSKLAGITKYLSLRLYKIQLSDVLLPNCRARLMVKYFCFSMRLSKTFILLVVSTM